MPHKNLKKIRLPHFDDKEQAILNEIKRAGWEIFRTDLRKKIKGSNTTLVKKISSLEKKGIIEEFKLREHATGRLKRAYRLTSHARWLFQVERVLKMEKWFSASQKIELFPEFAHTAKVLMGEGRNVYEMLGIKPQHIFIETLLATNNFPLMADEEIREVLTACNAFLQNLVTSKLHTEPNEQSEGYIIFHYMTAKQKEELLMQLSQCLMNYIISPDPLERHEAVGKMAELTVKHPDLASTITMAAANIAHCLTLEAELRDLAQKYKAFEKEKNVRKSTRAQLILSVLNIFKKLYISSNRTRTEASKKVD